MSEAASNTSVPQKQVNPVETVQKTEQFEVIEPKENKTSEIKPQVKDPTNMENNSIINQEQNKIPSLKEESESHNQNQPVPTNSTQQTQVFNKPQTIVTSQPQLNPVSRQSTIKPTSTTQISPQQTHPSKLIPTTQAPKTIPSQSKIQSNKTQASTPQQPQIKPQIEPQVETTQKTQQTKSNKQIQPSITNKQSQKSTKDLPSTKEIKKEESHPVQKPTEKDSQKIKSETKLITEKVPQQKKQQGFKQKLQQIPKPAPSVQNKVMDSLEKAQTKPKEQAKKQAERVNKSQPAVVKSQKQITAKNEHTQSKNQKPIQRHQIPQSDQGTSLNELLKLLLEKCKQEQQKGKTKTQLNNNITGNNQTDLNLILASSNLPTQYPQNRIKLQFKISPNHLIQLSQPTKPSEKQQLSDKPELSDKPQLSNKLQAEHKQPQQPHQSTQQNPPKPATYKKSSDFKLAFYMYNLKEPNNNHNQISEQKIKNIETLQTKLEEATASLDPALFSFQVTQKNQLKTQKNKLPLRTVKFNLLPTFISSYLGIKPQRLEQFHALLKTLQDKSEQSKMSQSQTLQVVKQQGQNSNQEGIEEKVSVDKKLQKNSSVSFATSAQITVSEPLKNIESDKLLTLMSNGFKMRLQSKRDKQFVSLPNLLEKALREATFCLAPSLLTDYLGSVSSGSANIKFRSIKDLRRLLTRLGINQIFDQTPTTKEVLKDLIQIQLKSLFKVKAKAEKGAQTQEKGKDKGVDQGKTSEIWKVFQAVFAEANCQGLSIQVTLYQIFTIRLTFECCSKSISQVWAEALK